MALLQIIDWLGTLAFGAEDLDQVADAVAACRRDIVGDQRVSADRLESSGSAAVRAFGARWLEWRWLEKPSGKKLGPYGYYRWRQGGRKRTKYVGKVATVVTRS